MRLLFFSKAGTVEGGDLGLEKRDGKESVIEEHEER